MTDLETAAAPSKSVDNVIQCPSVDLMHRQSSYAKSTPKPMKIPENLPWGHPSTQLYVRPQDDPLPATTMNRAITMPKHLAACLPQQKPQTTRGNSTVMGIRRSKYQHPHHPSTQTYTAPHNDPLLEPNPHHAITTLTERSLHKLSSGRVTKSQNHVAINVISNIEHPDLPSTDHIREKNNQSGNSRNNDHVTWSPTEPVDIDKTFQNITAHLNYLETFLCALLAGVKPPPVPTELLNNKSRDTHVTNQQQHDRPATTITSKPHTTLDGNDHKPCQPDNSHHDSHDATQCGPEAHPQNIAHEFDRQSSTDNPPACPSLDPHNSPTRSPHSATLLSALIQPDPT